MVTDRFAVAEFEAESVTLTVKLALPAAGVVPDKTPPFDRLNPMVVNCPLPEVTVHVRPLPEPPEVINV
jgi:hypothetical protein